MKAQWIVFLIFVSSFLAWTDVFAGQSFVPFFSGVREEGMGGAAVAVVDDETALLLNPAGLGKIRGSYFALANLQGESNYDTIGSVTQQGGNYNLLTDPSNIFAAAKANPGKYLYADAQTLPSFVTTNFGIGAYGRYSMDAQYTSATDKYHLDYTNDYGAVVGYCFRLFEGKLKIGISGKVIDRVYASKDFTSAQIGSTTLANTVSEGTGVGWDGSVMLTAPWEFLPTLTAVAHDIGNTKFTLNNGYIYKPSSSTAAPPPQMQSIDVGFAIFPITGHHSRMALTAEYRDIQNPSPSSIESLHFGAEINVGDTLYLRGGVNQGYYTAGLEIDIGNGQLQGATYGANVGTDTAPLQDRRYVLMYGFRL